MNSFEDGKRTVLSQSKETMTSRQRVMEVLHHRIPDRTPIDLGMYTASGISAFAYQHLRDYLQLPKKPIEIYECVQVLPRVQEDVLKRLHCDCMVLNPRRSDLQPWTPREGYHFQVPPPSYQFRGVGCGKGHAENEDAEKRLLF